MLIKNRLIPAGVAYKVDGLKRCPNGGAIVVAEGLYDFFLTVWIGSLHEEKSSRKRPKPALRKGVLYVKRRDFDLLKIKPMIFSTLCTRVKQKLVSEVCTRVPFKWNLRFNIDFCISVLLSVPKSRPQVSTLCLFLGAIAM